MAHSRTVGGGVRFRAGLVVLAGLVPAGLLWPSIGAAAEPGIAQIASPGDSIFDAFLLADQEAAGTDGAVQTGNPASCDVPSCCPPGAACAPGAAPFTPPYAGPSTPPSTAPLAPPMTTPDAVFAPDSSQALVAARSRAPAMIGDFFGGAFETTAEGDNEGGLVIDAFGVAGFQVGRLKLAENTSPIPQDRVFFNYSFFDNTPLLRGGVNVHRYTPGFEKTFFDGLMSLEARFPFAQTLESTFIVNRFAEDQNNPFVTGPDTGSFEFGNITLFLKTILYEAEMWTVTTGLGIAIPTANDIKIVETANNVVLQVENDSVHLLPFLAGVYTPSERCFFQAFVQFDFDANGNPVFIESRDVDIPQTRLGVVNDQTYLFADVGLGYWVYRNPCSSHGVTGIAPRFELHYNRSISDPDVVAFNVERGGTGGNPTSGQVSSGRGTFELFNALVGVTMELHNNSTLTLAYVTPIGGGSDQQFDGELRVLLNYFFGPQIQPASARALAR